MTISRVPAGPAGEDHFPAGLAARSQPEAAVADQARLPVRMRRVLAAVLTRAPARLSDDPAATAQRNGDCGADIKANCRRRRPAYAGNM